MPESRLVFVILLFSLAGCESDRSISAPPPGLAEDFADAINTKDVEATMAHWSDDAVMYFQFGDADSVEVSRAEIRKNYEHMFADEYTPHLEIRVDGVEQSGDIAHEWGSYSLGNSNGCYVILRRASDGWKIYREWIVEPCGY